MQKYAKIVNEETKICEVGLGSNENFYKSLGMTLQEVEQAWDGQYYIAGYAPQKPAEIVKAEEIADLKAKLTASDYAVIKIAEGAATPEEYAELIASRQAWRARINELEA